VYLWWDKVLLEGRYALLYLWWDKPCISGGPILYLWWDKRLLAALRLKRHHFRSGIHENVGWRVTALIAFQVR
jgi:hypothetical protein